MTDTTNTTAASVEANNCTILPDGSAFAVASFPLPKDHWLYAPREYDVDAEHPKELPSPILTHALRAEVVSAIRYAIRGATMCGKETDFDPDALVQNAVYALCGPYGSAALAAPSQAVPASLITASIMRDDGGEHPAFCLMVAYRAEKDATAALAMLTNAPAQPRDDAVFVVWWSDHMPNSTEADAWAEWCALRSNQPDPAVPAQAGEYPELPDLYSTGAPFWRAVLAWHDAHHGPEAINAADKLDMLVADMLRAYVDADRAARGAAQAQEDAPDMFWDADDTEKFAHEVQDIVDGYCSGEIVTIECAKRRPNFRVLITGEGDNSLSYEHIDAASAAQQGGKA